jgi:CRISPR/Cas system-associated exonuclease Cas4 (RecB family)
MLEIMTIRDFMSLPVQHQQEIQKSLRVKDRLEVWLKSLNNKSASSQPKQPFWSPCKYCAATASPGKCVGCSPEAPGWELIEPRDNSDIHPSQINKCLKNLWFCCAGYAEQFDEYIDPRLQMIFDLGHAWHHTVQSYGKRGAWSEKQYYRPEVPIDPDELLADGRPALPVANEFWIKGSVDAIIDRYVLPSVPMLGDVTVRMIHEYKTINSNSFQNLKRPKTEHKWQATIYSKVFDIPLVVFHYVNKDNCNHIDYPVPFDHSVWSTIQGKIEKVQHYHSQGSPPPWEETAAVINPTECKSCGYYKICQPPDRR